MICSTFPPTSAAPNHQPNPTHPRSATTTPPTTHPATTRATLLHVRRPRQSPIQHLVQPRLDHGSQPRLPTGVHLERRLG